MPARQNSLIEPIIQRICDAADPAQPYARQLEQVATAAVRYGLRNASAPGACGSQPVVGLRGKIEAAVADFTASPRQAALERACRQAGVPQISVLAGVVLKHCHQDLTPLTTEQVARYALEFALALVESRPALAEQYRRRLARQRRSA